MSAFEVNFDGIVGPTHNYGGLSYGNVASVEHQNWKSHPKSAALQGLKKMKFLMEMGFSQAVLPPHERPDVRTLRKLGFEAETDSEVVSKVAKSAPEILAMVSSASSMWAANTATVSPSADSSDGRVHFTPANLTQNFHRSLESRTASKILKAIFSDENHFSHHSPLPRGDLFSDEGAANHTRFCSEYSEPGVQLFVYGREQKSASQSKTERFPARQSLDASRTIARLHLIDEKRAVFARQNPEVIDQGVFHNDVIAVGNQNLLFCHERAFENQNQVLVDLRAAFGGSEGTEKLHVLTVKEEEVAVEDAVKSYLFNTQLLPDPKTPGKMILIAPEECRENSNVSRFLKEKTGGESIISTVHFLNLRQSMQNGGGPACLRLRVVLDEKERQAALSSVFLDSALYDKLVRWVEKHYRDELSAADLADSKLLEEGRHALDELTQILNLGSIYDFQNS